MPAFRSIFVAFITIIIATPGGNPSLLQYGTATDTCLRCHAAHSNANRYYGGTVS